MDKVELFLVVKVTMNKSSDFNGPDVVGLVQGCIGVGFSGAPDVKEEDGIEIQVMEGFCG